MRQAILWTMLALTPFAVSEEIPRFEWVNYTVADGLPDNKVYNVLVDGEKIWAATDNGLALLEKGRFTIFRPADGLAHRAVLYLSMDSKKHELWIATMGGLNRYSAGRFETFTQFNSGLPNNVVYGVAASGDEVWTATAAGAGRLNTKTMQWSLYNERNTPMYEIWTYAVSPGDDKVYYAVWGGGLLEFDRATDRWKNYDDPDGETEIVLYKDQGLIHEITTSVSYVNKIVWVGTYFGVSRYDGRNWKNFLQKDSGLPSNFINQLKSVDGTRTWFATDKGLAYYDGGNWACYRPALDTKAPEMTVRRADGVVTKVPVTSAPAHNYILGMDFQGDDIWVATSKGLSHGIRIKEKDNDGARRALSKIAGAAGVEKRAITNLKVLNEAYAYGSAFSRGLRIDLNGLVILLISGTASIDESGKTLHVGDFRAQCRRTFENIRGLLESEGASWKDIVRTTCYLRDIERDYAAFNEERTTFYREQGLHPLPASTGIQAILCRPDLLVEIEAIAMFTVQD